MPSMSYEALETIDSSVQVLGDETLCTLACELVETVRRRTKIDWTFRANVHAQIRVLVKGYYESMTIHLTSKRPQRTLCSNKPNCCQGSGLCEGSTFK